ncbi:MAG: hypothetical protein LBK99_27365 [Opitutaceae bacterium]|nr:hypothetical protein [Opitutaceae bacterium]
MIIKLGKLAKSLPLSGPLPPAIAIAAIAIAAAAIANAATYDWSGTGNGSWTSVGNWTVNETAATVVPGADDSIRQTVRTDTASFVRTDTRNRYITDYTYAATGNFSFYSTNSSSVSDTLYIRGTLTVQQASGNLVARNSGGLLNLDVGNLIADFAGNGTTTSLQLGGYNTAGPLDGLSVSGSTTIKNSSILYLNVTTTAVLGTLKWDATATGGTVYLHAGQEGSAGSPSTRTVNVASIDGATTTATISGVIGSNANRAATLAITGATGTTTFAGKIVNNSNNNANGTLSVQKTGASTQILTGANTWTGTTTITDGKLVINGTHTGAGAYTVSGGDGNEQGTLSGTGTITTADANITIAPGGHLAPGNDTGGADNGAGTLTLALGSGKLDLAVAGFSSLHFTLGAPGTGTSVALTSGTIDIGADNLSLASFRITATDGFGTGAYTLLGSTETIIGTLGANLTGVINGHEATLALSDDNKSIILNIGALAPAIPEPATITVLLAATTLLAALAGSRRTRKH